MTYLAGIGPGLLAIGMAPRDPSVVCDGCGAKHGVAGPRGPFAWFLDGKAPPRWLIVRDGDRRSDYCPKCKEDRP